MKKNIVLFIALLGFIKVTFAQDIKPATAGTIYGENVTQTNATAINKINYSLGKANTAMVKTTGKVVDVCTKKGCWMKLDAGNGKTTMVKFKDYGFFVPADIVGKTVVMDGIAKQETTSVDDLKHFAEDAGKSKEEIAKIKNPKKEITYEAKGVLVL